jgi:hypothetical protein
MLRVRYTNGALRTRLKLWDSFHSVLPFVTPICVCARFTFMGSLLDFESSYDILSSNACELLQLHDALKFH